MKRIILLVVAFLLCIGLIATLNQGEYIGLTGLLNELSTIDFSFSDTTQIAINAFEKFENIVSGNGGEFSWSNSVSENFGVIKGYVENATTGLFDLVRVPFVAIQEFISLLSDIFDLLFKLVGVF